MSSSLKKISLHISTSFLDTHPHSLKYPYRECAFTLSPSTITELHVKRASSELNINNLIIYCSIFLEIYLLLLGLRSHICNMELKSYFNIVRKGLVGRSFSESQGFLSREPIRISLDALIPQWKLQSCVWSLRSGTGKGVRPITLPPTCEPHD